MLHCEPGVRVECSTEKREKICIECPGHCCDVFWISCKLDSLNRNKTGDERVLEIFELSTDEEQIAKFMQTCTGGDVCTCRMFNKEEGICKEHDKRPSICQEYFCNGARGGFVPALEEYKD